MYGNFSAPTLSSVVEQTCGTPVPTTSSYQPLPPSRILGYSSAAPEFAAPKTAPAYESPMPSYYLTYASLSGELFQLS